VAADWREAKLGEMKFRRRLRAVALDDGRVVIEQVDRRGTAVWVMFWVMLWAAWCCGWMHQPVVVMVGAGLAMAWVMVCLVRSRKWIELTPEGVLLAQRTVGGVSRRLIEVEAGARVAIEVLPSLRGSEAEPDVTESATKVVVMQLGLRFELMGVGRTDGVLDAVLLTREVERYFKLGSGGDSKHADLPIEATQKEARALAAGHVYVLHGFRPEMEVCPAPVALGGAGLNARLQSGEVSGHPWVRWRWWRAGLLSWWLIGLVALTALLGAVTLAVLGLFHPLIHLLLPAYLAVAWWYYAWLARLVNMTMAHIHPDRLELHPAPLWYPGKVTVARGEVEHVVVRVELNFVNPMMMAEERVWLGVRKKDGAFVDLDPKRRLTPTEVWEAAGLLAGALGVNKWVKGPAQELKGRLTREIGDHGIRVERSSEKTVVTMAKHAGAWMWRVWMTGIMSCLLLLMEAVFVMTAKLPIWLAVLTLGVGVGAAGLMFYVELVRFANKWRVTLREEEAWVDETPFRWFIKAKHVDLAGVTEVDAGLRNVMVYRGKHRIEEPFSARDLGQSRELARILREHLGLPEPKEKAEELTDLAEDFAWTEEETEEYLGKRETVATMTAQECMEHAAGMRVISKPDRLDVKVNVRGPGGWRVWAGWSLGFLVMVLLGNLMVHMVVRGPFHGGFVMLGMIELFFWVAFVSWLRQQWVMEATYEQLSIRPGPAAPNVGVRGQPGAMYLKVDPASIDGLELRRSDEDGVLRLYLVKEGERPKSVMMGKLNENQMRAVVGMLMWFYGWGNGEKKEGESHVGEEARG
jgi:hypothetical protein